MRWKSHVRFGGRAGETHRQRCRQGAPVRPLHVAVRSLEPEGDVGVAAEISEGDVEGDVDLDNEQTSPAPIR